MWSRHRMIAALALVPWLAASPALPPEHIHEAAADHHHDAVAHRHFTAHDHDSAMHDQGDAEVEPGEEQIVWIDEAAIVQAPHVVHHDLVIVPSRAAVLATGVSGASVVADEATLPHGPPRRSSSPRAPPASFQLI